MPFPLKHLNKKRRGTVKSVSKPTEPLSSGSSMQVSTDGGYSYSNLMQVRPMSFPVPRAIKGTKFMASTFYPSLAHIDNVL